MENITKNSQHKLQIMEQSSPHFLPQSLPNTITQSVLKNLSFFNLHCLYSFSFCQCCQLGLHFPLPYLKSTSTLLLLVTAINLFDLWAKTKSSQLSFRANSSINFHTCTVQSLFSSNSCTLFMYKNQIDNQSSYIWTNPILDKLLRCIRVFKDIKDE